MGPLMIDVAGYELTGEDKDILEHPLVGGLILFTRNYDNPEQLAELTQQIKLAAKKDILIAVDHEGGRVQRFRKGFTHIPSMGSLWFCAQENINQAKEYAKFAGQLMAIEVQTVGIDISFAPVLDINDISDVIGDRAFHCKPEIVSKLATSFIQGMQSVGMKATGKHFPGHGSVKEDSHVALPVDKRGVSTIYKHDLLPFKTLIEHKLLGAMMPAHIIFPAVDSEAVGFSKKWLQDILRTELGFDGVIFSDDLSMEGASVVGGFVERAESAQQAGCDMLLMCNDRNAAINIIDNAALTIHAQSQTRLRKMLKPQANITTLSTMKKRPQWQEAFAVIDKLNTQIN